MHSRMQAFSPIHRSGRDCSPELDYMNHHLRLGRSAEFSVLDTGQH